MDERVGTDAKTALAFKKST